VIVKIADFGFACHVETENGVCVCVCVCVYVCVCVCVLRKLVVVLESEHHIGYNVLYYITQNNLGLHLLCSSPASSNLI
jgi:hypothetical protein